MKKITEKTITKLVEMGAKRWTKAGHDRLYIGDAFAEICGHLCDHDFEGVSNNVRYYIWNGNSNDYINLSTGDYVGARSERGHGGSITRQANDILADAEQLENLISEMFPETEEDTEDAEETVVDVNEENEVKDLREILQSQCLEVEKMKLFLRSKNGSHQERKPVKENTRFEEIVVQGHKISEKYNWDTQLWEYYTDDNFEFGVRERVSPDELVMLFHNGFLSAQPRLRREC